MRRILIIGATGDVGQGVVSASVDAGWQVIAASRSDEKLQRLKAQFPAIETQVGDINSEAGAEQLWAAANGCFNGIDAIVVSVNAPIEEQKLFPLSPDELVSTLQANVVSHFIAAKTFIPKLNQGAVYIGIGGGMADFLAPNMAPVSMSQAALRMMYRGFAKELGEDAPHMKELMILSMVNGQSRRENAQPEWLTDVEIGQHLRAIIEQPERFPKSILKLQSREQVGAAE